MEVYIWRVWIDIWRHRSTIWRQTQLPIPTNYICQLKFLLPVKDWQQFLLGRRRKERARGSGG